METIYDNIHLIRCIPIGHATESVRARFRRATGLPEETSDRWSSGMASTVYVCTLYSWNEDAESTRGLKHGKFEADISATDVITGQSSVSTSIDGRKNQFSIRFHNKGIKCNHDDVKSELVCGI